VVITKEGSGVQASGLIGVPDSGHGACPDTAELTKDRCAHPVIPVGIRLATRTVGIRRIIDGVADDECAFIHIECACMGVSAVSLGRSDKRVAPRACARSEIHAPFIAEGFGSEVHAQGEIALIGIADIGKPLGEMQA